MESAAASRVFEVGEHSVHLSAINPSSCPSCSVAASPPKSVIVAAPCEEGDFPVLLFLHGYLLSNSFYSQLITHVASHGFIVVAPQLYSVSGPHSSEEIKWAARVTDWLSEGLPDFLPKHVRPDTTKVGVSGHSRGGKVAFALALSHVKSKLRYSVLMAIDPVDGMDVGKQTHPPILTYTPRSFNFIDGTSALVVGSGLGGTKKNPFFPPCAPEGVSHQSFFEECCSPAFHFVVKDYGHMDVLDDETKGVRGRFAACLCPGGKERKPMREFTGGVMVAFMKAYLQGDHEELDKIRDHPELAPVEISTVSYI